MDGAKVIKQLLIERNMKITDLAKMLEIEPQSARNKLNRNSFTLAEFQKILLLLDAELQVITRDTKKVYK